MGAVDADLVGAAPADDPGHEDLQLCEQLRRDHADLVDEDEAEPLALRRELVIVARGGGAVRVPHGQAGPVVHGVAVDGGGHRVLEGEAHELDPVRPVQLLLEELAEPPDELALARARHPVDDVEERAVAVRGGAALLLRPSLELDALDDLPEEPRLLLRGRLLPRLQGLQPAVHGGSAHVAVRLRTRHGPRAVRALLLRVLGRRPRRDVSLHRARVHGSALGEGGTREVAGLPPEPLREGQGCTVVGAPALPLGLALRVLRRLAPRRAEEGPGGRRADLQRGDVFVQVGLVLLVRLLVGCELAAAGKGLRQHGRDQPGRVLGHDVALDVAPPGPGEAALRRRLGRRRRWRPLPGCDPKVAEQRDVGPRRVQRPGPKEDGHVPRVLLRGPGRTRHGHALQDRHVGPRSPGEYPGVPELLEDVGRRGGVGDVLGVRRRLDDDVVHPRSRLQLALVVPGVRKQRLARLRPPRTRGGVVAPGRRQGLALPVPEELVRGQQREGRPVERPEAVEVHPRRFAAQAALVRAARGRHGDRGRQLRPRLQL